MTAPKICILLNDLKLSGGVGVVVAHAELLARDHGFDVTLAVAATDHNGWDYVPADSVKVVCADEIDESFDIAMATWWETAYGLFEVDARRHAYFVQSLEERFYRVGDPERIGAAFTHELPVALITEARWIADTLEQLRPQTPCYYVRNGIDKRVFEPTERPHTARNGPLRILLEGHPDVWIKAIGEAAEAVSRMTEDHVTTLVSPGSFDSDVDVDHVVGPLSQREMADLYSETDVLLKLSRVEGMFGPPLEAFHRGATCVVTPVTGHDEYVVHGHNGVVVDWDDPRGTARWLDLLARNRRFLHFLRHNALETARGWPSREQSSQFMAAALMQILRDPPPQLGAGALRSVLSGAEDYRNAMILMRSKLDSRRSFGAKLAACARRNLFTRILFSPLLLAGRLARRVWRRVCC